jgi:hypothetical protein
MIVAGSASPLLLASAAGGYNLTRSLRFRGSASASLTRTPASAGNRRTFTYSTWVKRGSLSGVPNLLKADNGTIEDYFRFTRTSDDCTINFATYDGTNQYRIQSTAVYRDPSAWYHFVLRVDTTQATSSNRYRIYVNGSQVTSFSFATYPPQNYEIGINSNIAHSIGSSNLDGYLTEVNFVDGQSLDPSSFGENNEDTGVWQPIKYAGTYGTNGFYLPFTDNSALTTSSNVGLGKDFSGNGNYWTTNNISITAGSTYDSMTDVPTLTSATTSNFAVLNPLYNYPAPQLSNGNLTTSNSATAVTGALSTIGVTSGKWYFEATNTTTVNQSTSIGIVDSTFNFNAGAAYIIDGTTYRITGNPTFASYTNGDTIGVAFDADASTISFYKNGTLQGTGNYGYLTNGTPVFPYVYIRDDATGAWNANFGQRPFAYTPPTGFVALNTFNLPTPTIGATASTQANKYFDINLWTGNASARSITNSGFKPAFVWAKSRSNVPDNVLNDSNRGAGLTLISNSTNAEVNEGTSGLTSFDTSGFSIGGSSGGWNTNGYTYVGWQWRGSDSTAVTNTAGSITSTVSANTSAGFSVITYDGIASAGTVGHGLGVAPKMIIVKRRSAVDPWVVWHTSLANTEYLYLNSTAGKATNTTYWNSTFPTSSVFSLGLTNDVNATSSTYVAYVFSEIAGYSKFGSYTGNGSADGTFVYTGFRPRFIMLKRSDTAGPDWYMLDTARDPFNAMRYVLFANKANAEADFTQVIDDLSNGFKLRLSDADFNASGGTYIYMAFAENPFKYSLAR